MTGLVKFFKKIYYIDPESNVFHVDWECPALNHPWRYYPLSTARGSKAVEIQKKRRPCRKCVPGDVHVEYE